MQSSDKHVLVIEDNKTMQTLLQALLESDGFTVITCPDALSALNTSKERDFCAYVVDYQLPGMKGDDLTAALRRDRPNSIIIGCSYEFRKQEFLSAGADDFILKENLVSQLLPAISKSLHRSVGNTAALS